MSYVILLGQRERSVPKPLRILPVGSLNSGAPGKKSNDHECRGAENFAAITNATQKIDNSPGRRDAQPDLRQVHIAIGMGLTADLNQSDDGQEHDQIPKPASDEIGRAFAKDQSARANQD